MVVAKNLLHLGGHVSTSRQVRRTMRSMVHRSAACEESYIVRLYVPYAHAAAIRPVKTGARRASCLSFATKLGIVRCSFLPDPSSRMKLHGRRRTDTSVVARKSTRRNERHRRRWARVVCRCALAGFQSSFAFQENHLGLRSTRRPVGKHENGYWGVARRDKTDSDRPTSVHRL